MSSGYSAGDSVGAAVGASTASSNTALAAATASTRYKQMAALAAAGGAIDAGITTVAAGVPVENTMGFAVKGAVSVWAADMTTDYLVGGSSIAKSVNASIPAVVTSEPVLSGLYHYLFARYFQPRPTGTAPSLILEFALGVLDDVGARAAVNKFLKTSSQ